MSEVYVEVRVFKWDAQEHGPFPDPPNGLIDKHVVAFKNLANATATFEDLERSLSVVEDKGVPEMADRFKGGPKRKG